MFTLVTICTLCTTCTLCLYFIGSDELISKQVHQMESGLKKLKGEVERHKKPQDSGDKFASRMTVSVYMYMYNIINLNYLYIFPCSLLLKLLKLNLTR